ncbi:metal ABC transporter ATP-binding protein [Luteolibacter sp. AS25]|uniref:metal ABC transporter ATP-binding protein n=1 Tax=Luteolibacter sp. AS25 TaxID=3135776 RepID=UPI00398B266A
MNQGLENLGLSHDCGNPTGHQLRVDSLTVRYADTVALESVDMRTRCGRCVALVGPNGAGKSTLMKSLAGLIKPDSGGITWRGNPLSRSTAEIAYLAQRSQVDWHFPLTVRGLVEMGRFPHLGWWRRFRRVDHEVVDNALELMKLMDLAKRQISALSGGQQQRAFVARALAQEAHVLLLDEPFTGLDRPSQELLTELLGLLAKGGRLILAAHHDLASVPDIFDEVLLLKRKSVAFGPVAEVFNEKNLNECFGERRVVVAKSKVEI